MKKFFILDERQVWFAAAIKAAKNHGFIGKRIMRGAEVDDVGVGFIRPHVDPPVLIRNQRDYAQMSDRLTMIQDLAQVALYENKSGQFHAWGKWMPDTWRFVDEQDALDFVHSYDAYPLVSKADVGASSVNVRILKTKVEAVHHVRKLFGSGIMVEHSSEVPRSLQKGYVLLQRFIPHQVTWRVNALGDARAIFRRFCYKHKPVAQTGNVEPVMEMSDEVASLLEYANVVFKDIGSKWCALDILKDTSDKDNIWTWKLLETSLAWPWPSPGKCNEGTIFGSSRPRKWIDMFEVMFDQFEEGAWAHS